MPNSSLEIIDIWHFFDEEPVLRDLTNSLHSGSLYLVEGANGAGKSTLLRILAGILSPTEGTSSFCKAGSQCRTSQATFSNIAYAIGQAPMYDALNCEDNLRILDIGNEELDTAISGFGLGSVRSTKFSCMSLGYKQRLWLSSVFAFNSEWIILDEPSVFLDKEGRSCLLSALDRSLKRGAGCVIASHESPLFSSFKSTKLFLDRGSLSDRGMA